MTRPLRVPSLPLFRGRLFQPVWARLIDGLLEAGARRIAFDVVFAYAGADFQVGAFTLPDYDRSLIDSLEPAGSASCSARFPSVAPAPPFLRRWERRGSEFSTCRLESDGRVRSTAPIVRLADGRIALGFAALGAGLSVRQASAAQRLLLTPSAPLRIRRHTVWRPCSPACHRRKACDEFVMHRRPDRRYGYGGAWRRRAPRADAFSGRRPPPRPARSVRTAQRAVQTPTRRPCAGGAACKIAAIQSAASDRPVLLAPTWLRLIAGAGSRSFSPSWLCGTKARWHSASAMSRRARSCSCNWRGRLRSDWWARSFSAACLAPRRSYSPTFGCRWAIPSWLRFSHLQRSLGFVRSAIGHLFRSLYRTAGRYLPPARLVTLARSSFADPLDGHEREVSILLADLAGFTSFSNRPDLTASEIVRVANRYFTLMQAAIDRHDGCSDKFLGDAVLAFLERAFG